MQNKLFYVDGVELKKNDIVLIANEKKAIVEDVLSPCSKQAEDYSCYESGGFLLKFNDGDVQVWRKTDEDICLIERGK